MDRPQLTEARIPLEIPEIFDDAEPADDEDPKTRAALASANAMRAFWLRAGGEEYARLAEEAAAKIKREAAEKAAAAKAGDAKEGGKK